MVSQEIFVEFGGKRKKVSLSELQTLIQKNYLSSNSSIWIDGRQVLLDDIRYALGSEVVFTETLKDLFNSCEKAPDSSDEENQELLKLKADVPVSVPLAPKQKNTRKVVGLFCAALAVVVLTLMIFSNGKEDVNKSEVPKEKTGNVEEGNCLDDPTFRFSKKDVEDSASSENVGESPLDNEPDFSSNADSLDASELEAEENELDVETDVEETDSLFSKRTQNQTSNVDENDISHYDKETAYRSEDATESTEFVPFGKRRSIEEYTNEPFALTDDKLPVGFKGVDVEELQENIVDLLAGLDLEKGTYESVKQYETRLKRTYQELLDRKLLGEITFLSRIAIVFPSEKTVKDGRRCTFAKSSYDSLQKKLVVTLSDSGGLGRFGYDEDERCDVSVVYEKSDVHREYNLEKARWVISDVPTEQAQKLNDSCAVLCLCALQTGVNIQDSSSFYTSKFRTLYELYENRERTLYVKKAEYWIYNENTGEVIAKFTEQETLRSQGKSWKETSRRLDDSSTNTSASSSAARTNEEDDNAVEQQGKPSPKFRTITVPDDAGTLAEAFQIAHKHDVILLKKSSTPYSLGVDSTWLKIGKKIVVKGETGDPSDVAICFKSGQSLRIQSDDVSFEGITFLRESSSHNVCVWNSNANIQFQRCDFKCNSGGEDAIGLLIEGFGATCELNDCKFCNFGVCALDVDDSGKAILTDCSFEKNQKTVQLRNKGKCDVQKTLFLSNQSVLLIEGGCEAIVKGCNFKGNDQVWARQAGAIVQTSENEGDK